MIAASLEDLKTAAGEAPAVVDMLLDPFLRVEQPRVMTKDGLALVLRRDGHSAADYAGLVVVLSTLLPVRVRCYRPTPRGRWTRVRP